MSKGCLPHVLLFLAALRFFGKNDEKKHDFFEILRSNFFEKNQKLKQKKNLGYFFPRYFRKYLQRFSGSLSSLNSHELCDIKTFFFKISIFYKKIHLKNNISPNTKEQSSSCCTTLEYLKVLPNGGRRA